MTLNWGDPKMVAEQQNLIKAAQAERDKNLPPEQREANLVKALSPGNTAVISAAVDAGNTTYAKEYLLQNAQYITPENRLVLARAVETGDFEARTQKFAEDIYTEAKGDKATAFRLARERYSGKDEDRTVERLKARFAEDKEVDPTKVQTEAERILKAVEGNTEKAMALARTELESDLENAVLKKIEEMDREKTVLRERRQKEAREAGFAAYNKTGSFSKIPATVIAAMDPTDVANLKQFAENRAYTQTLRGEAAERRKQAALYRSAAPEFLTLYSDIEKLEKMSPTDIILLEPRLGPQHTESLLKRREQIENREGRLTAKMDDDQFKALATEYGFNAFKPTTKQKEVLGLLQSRVDMMLEDAAKKKRQPLSKEEKAAIMKDAMKQEVEIDGFFFNSTKPALTLTPAEEAKVIVPASERKIIVETLRELYNTNKSAEYAPTEENIRKLYIRGLRK
jgi:hypothetical protein